MTYGAARAESKRPAVKSAQRERGRRTIVLVSFLLSLAAVGWGFVRIPGALDAGAETLAAADRVEKDLAEARAKAQEGTTVDSDLAVKAKIEFEQAKAFASDHPEDFGGIRSRYLAVRDEFGTTAYGYLAQKEMDENEVRRRKATDREFDTLAKQAAACIEENRLYDAYELLDDYERTHPGTLYATRAEREALNLLETIAARFDEDMDRVHRLTREGDYGRALDILAGVRTYAGPDERTKAEREVREIRQRIRETQLPEGGTEPPPAEAPKKPDPGPAVPPVGEKPPVAEGPRASPEEEKKAERLFADARKAFEREKYADALEATTGLEALGNTSVCRANAKEIRRIHGLSRLEVLGPAALFRGAVKVIRGREVEITYDFSTPEQVKDWTYTTPFAHPLSGSFWIQSDALHGRGVGAAVHPGEFEPGTLTLKCRAKALEPHDFGFLMLEPEEQVNYYLYAVQNRFFVIKLDRPVHENVLGVVGTGAWADTPDGFLGWVRKNGSPKPEVTAGEWLTLEARKLKGTMEMVVKGTSIKGSAFGDNRYVFPGLQPAVYVIKGDALFDDIVIRGTLKETWIANRMRWEKKRLIE